MDINADNLDVVTMLDVLEEEKEFTDQASAVLSGSDEKNCNGFVKRQALYACLTCAPAAAKNNFSKSIGICLACSLHCHEKHELVELYTKRNFRCDCGIKQGSSPCQLDIKKTFTDSSSSSSNGYNQNFVGLYCTCHRPYPDPENPMNEEMIQCVNCEDWFHFMHLTGKAPASTAFEEMICGGCMAKNDFLLDYTGLSVCVIEPEGDKDDSVAGGSSIAVDDIAPESKKIKLADDACVRPKIDTSKIVRGTTTYWKEGWRQSLCKCSECMKVYEAMQTKYLIDLEDTSRVYEEMGKRKEPVEDEYAASMEALSHLPRVNQIDAISSYNRMKDKLFEFLQTFVTNNQIVTEEDIQRFFRTMKESNDQQQPVNQPHFCR